MARIVGITSIYTHSQEFLSFPFTKLEETEEVKLFAPNFFSSSEKEFDTLAYILPSKEESRKA